MPEESIESIKDLLEITPYDNIDSEDYLEILEHKFKKTIGIFSVFIHNLKCLKSKNAYGIIVLHLIFFLLMFIRRKKN